MLHISAQAPDLDLSLLVAARTNSWPACRNVDPQTKVTDKLRRILQYQTKKIMHGQAEILQHIPTLRDTKFYESEITQAGAGKTTMPDPTRLCMCQGTGSTEQEPHATGIHMTRMLLSRICN